MEHRKLEKLSNQESENTHSMYKEHAITRYDENSTDSNAIPKVHVVDKRELHCVEDKDGKEIGYLLTAPFCLVESSDSDKFVVVAHGTPEARFKSKPSKAIVKIMLSEGASPSQVRELTSAAGEARVRENVRVTTKSIDSQPVGIELKYLGSKEGIAKKSSVIKVDYRDIEYIADRDGNVFIIFFRTSETPHCPKWLPWEITNKPQHGVKPSMGEARKKEMQAEVDRHRNIDNCSNFHGEDSTPDGCYARSDYDLEHHITSFH